MNDTIHEELVRDGITFNWNIFPSTRLDTSRLLTPIGCLYTPLDSSSVDEFNPSISNNGNPITCSSCNFIVNSHVHVNVSNRWCCPFCKKKTFSEGDGLRSPKSNTVIYKLPERIASDEPPFAYIFVVDLYLQIDQLENGSSPFHALIESITKNIEQIPTGCLIGLCSFNEDVHVHKLGLGSNSTSFSSNEYITTGKSIYDETILNTIPSKLGFNRTQLLYDWKSSPLVKNGYLLQLSFENRQHLINEIRQLKPSLTRTYGPSRSSGLAVYIATKLLSGSTFRNFKGKLSLFLSGPCTNFPGKVLDISNSNYRMRSHYDIIQLKVPDTIEALKFYCCMAYVANGFSFENANLVSRSISKKTTDISFQEDRPRWSIDIYAGSIDQVGLYEMRNLALTTMGNLFSFDSFQSRHFESSLFRSIARLVDKSTKLSAKLTVMTSSGLKILGMVSNGHHLPSSFQSGNNMHRHDENISDNIDLLGSSIKKKILTNEWYFNVLYPSDTISLFFDMDVMSSSKGLNINTGIKEVYIQFQLRYLDPSDMTWRLRVTTIKKPTTLSFCTENVLVTSSGSKTMMNFKNNIIKESVLINSFNQKTWIVLLCRLLIDKIDTILGYGQFDNIVKELDLILVNLLCNFGGSFLKAENLRQSSNPYNLLTNPVNGYSINARFKLLPSLVYHLRRNPQFVRIFNSSPDETAYYHHWLMKSNCDITCAMIKPNLYRLNSGKYDVMPLDFQVLGLSPSPSFFVMDSIFHVLIYYHFNQQKQDTRLDLHPSNNDEIVYTKDELVSEPLLFVEDHLLIQKGREIVSKYTLTQSGHSQARFLNARLNPTKSETYLSSSNIDLPTSSYGNKKKSIWKSIRSLLITYHEPSSKNKALFNEEETFEEYYAWIIDRVGDKIGKVH